jgi:hypothetical protein
MFASLMYLYYHMIRDMSIVYGRRHRIHPANPLLTNATCMITPQNHPHPCKKPNARKCCVYTIQMRCIQRRKRCKCKCECRYKKKVCGTITSCPSSCSAPASPLVLLRCYFSCLRHPVWLYYDPELGAVCPCRLGAFARSRCQCGAMRHVCD